MGRDVYYFTIGAFLLVVFCATVYLSFRGRTIAKYFLWSWALLLLLAVAAPFTALVKDIATTHVAGVTILFFLYTLFLINQRNQQQLEVAHEEIRRVLAESNRRMDEERRRISRRLHDDINPRLVLAKLELEQLLQLIAHAPLDDAAAARAAASIRKLMGSLSAVYQDSREIIKTTRIEIIESVGMTGAIESLVSHYNGILDSTHITLTHNLPARPPLPADLAINVYRILQEALLNAVKHASASNVHIDIRLTGRRYDVRVRDDGRGMADRSSQGIGLIDMRERARVLGSDLKIRSAAGRGTRISFSFSSPGP